MSETKTLLELQRCDTEIMRAKRELDELPEVQAIMECRAKRKEIKAKQDQVVELMDEVEAKMAKLNVEEQRVVEKLNTLQATLDSTSDYRTTQATTRDMEGQVKRQKSIAIEQDELLERQMKIEKVADQVADMLAKVNHAEDHHTESFKQKGGAIKERITDLEGRRASLSSQLDSQLAKRYESLRSEKNGIAVAVLEDDLCSACRSIILEGELFKLHKGPALAECPNCHRIMVVREEEDEA